jgi:hypothetical protein
MASSIKAKTLKVTINEVVTLGDNDFGNRTQFEITGINEATKRVLTVPTHQVTVLALSSSNGAGTYASGSLKYARLTNLDNANFVRLTFASGSKNQFDVKLEPRRTYVFSNDLYSGSAQGGTFDSFASFTNLKAVADSSAVDLEIYVASE